MTQAFLLFSGHNDRAVMALCRFFDKAGLPFVIVAAGRQDVIHLTRWKDNVIFNRIDSRVTVEWLCGLSEFYERGVVYCPTTEFINQFILDHRDQLSGSGMPTVLPETSLYHTLTGKLSSQALMTSLCPELHLPVMLSNEEWRAPCVLKPIQNIKNGRGQYPVLCRSADEMKHAFAAMDRTSCFVQEFVEGQSYYLCSYLSREGEFAAFWQENLIQQPGGKSIVLARACDNPGLDETRMFAGLHAMGYFGPFMLEVIRSQHQLYYIEVNPRFWGPLQLALDTCPDILRLFAKDQGFNPAMIPACRPDVAIYAWRYGANTTNCFRYPAACAMPETEIEHWLVSHDIYAKSDTLALTGRY